MELDKRIIEGKKPLFCLDTEEAKQFIGKEGYFTNHLGVFAHIRRIEKYMLTAIDEKAQSCFKDVDGVRWDWFLPTEWVKPEEPEKKYRPYTVMEFIKEYPLGSHLHFRPKNKLIEMHRLIDGYNDCLNGAGTLFMCGGMYSMSELYNNYEIFKDGEWQPFGVMEDD